jgi:hypothetical protein
MAISRAMVPGQDDPHAPGPLNVEVVPNNDNPPAPQQMPEPPASDFRMNLAELISDEDLSKIATELVELVDADDLTRADWIRTYTEGLDLLGFKGEERSEPFQGSAGVYHPLLTEATVRFQSNAITEIFPAAGPCLTKIMGDETPEKVMQSKRIKEEVNWQLTENMREYRNETEQLLFRLALAGSVFRKVYYDPLKRRPAACMVPAEDFIVDYGCSDLENSERYTHVMRKSENQVKRLMRSGFYREIKLQKPAMDAPPEGRQKEDEITGREQSPQVDNRYTLYEVHCYHNLPGEFEDPDGISDPYIITIEKQNSKVLSIYRNWNEEHDDPNYRCAEQYFVHYQYMPGLGFYGIGLIQLIGSIAGAATSILRQLIDAGTFSNFPGGLKTRGLRTKGDDTPIGPGEWRDVDVPAGTIAQNLFPMPYKEPSAVLAQLLGNLIEEGRRVGSIADLEVTSQSMNAPVGTTLALLERSLKVMSAVHARLHASLRREFALIGKVIGQYMDPKYEWDDQGQFNRQQDFSSKVDVLPVSDPSAATQAQKIVQMQAVQQQVAANPELYNLKEVHREGLRAIGIKNDERLLPADKDPPRVDPVQENMAFLTGQPVKVFEDQDHTAHIQVHLSLATDPKILEMLKASPSAAKIQGQIEAHLAEHLAHQYRAEMMQMMGTSLPPLGEEQPPEMESMLSRALADASVRLREMHQAQAQQKQAEEIAADPLYQLREREIALKERAQEHEEQKDAVDRTLDVAKEASSERLAYEKIESQERQASAKIGADLVTFGKELDNSQRLDSIKLGNEVLANLVDDEREVQKMTEQSNMKIRESQAKHENDRAQVGQKMVLEHAQHNQKLHHERLKADQDREHARLKGEQDREHARLQGEQDLKLAREQAKIDRAKAAAKPKPAK